MKNFGCLVNYQELKSDFEKSIVSKAKRIHQLQQQNKLHNQLFDSEIPRDFWKDIGKLGIANERKTFIPMEVLDENDQVKSQTSEILNEWRTDYEQIFNDNNCEAYDEEHLEEIADLVQNPDNNMFQKADCTSLNSPITLEEVRSSVYHATLRKATGLDNIPSDILRNEHCIELLLN